MFIGSQRLHGMVVNGMENKWIVLGTRGEESEGECVLDGESKSPDLCKLFEYPMLCSVYNAAGWLSILALVSTSTPSYPCYRGDHSE
jgi:hypothetical protein